jgi:hypothetical protein
MTSPVTRWLLPQTSHSVTSSLPTTAVVKLISWTDNSTSYISVNANYACKLMNFLQQNNEWCTNRITSLMQRTYLLPCPLYSKTAPDQSTLLLHILFTIHINVIIISGSWSYPGRPHLVFAPPLWSFRFNTDILWMLPRPTLTLFLVTAGGIYIGQTGS